MVVYNFQTFVQSTRFSLLEMKQGDKKTYENLGEETANTHAHTHTHTRTHNHLSSKIPSRLGGLGVLGIPFWVGAIGRNSSWKRSARVLHGAFDLAPRAPAWCVNPRAYRPVR